MAITDLVQALHEFLDAEVMLEQRRTEEGDATPQHQAFERAKRRLSDAMMDASNVPAERPLVVEGEAYLAAVTAFEQARNTMVEGTDVAGPARRLERAQGNLQDMLCRFAREASTTRDPAHPTVRRTRILVAVDGSQPSGWAVETAGQIATDLEAEIRLVHVTPYLPDVDPAVMPLSDPLDDAERAASEELLRAARARLPPAIEVSSIDQRGYAAAEIVNAARRWGADFIVVGTRGRGRLSRFVVGSTAEAVIRLAPCPVITVAHEPSCHSCGATTTTAAAHAPE